MEAQNVGYKKYSLFVPRDVNIGQLDRKVPFVVVDGINSYVQHFNSGNKNCVLAACETTSTEANSGRTERWLQEAYTVCGKDVNIGQLHMKISLPI